jgi:uncharacterized protein with von Willebrand factor type A (vWA) domain
MTMTMRRVLSLCAGLVAACIASPVMAGDYEQADDQCYWCSRDAIYQMTSLIAHLEANPDVDDAVKGPEITAARAEIHRLHATLGPPPQRWLTPCCYSRRPLYIR